MEAERKRKELEEQRLAEELAEEGAAMELSRVPLAVREERRRAEEAERKQVYKRRPVEDEERLMATFYDECNKAVPADKHEMTVEDLLRDELLQQEQESNRRKEAEKERQKERDRQKEMELEKERRKEREKQKEAAL